MQTKRALLVGAGGVSGAVVARELSARGWGVVAVGRDETRLRAELGSFAQVYLKADVTQPRSLESVAEHGPYAAFIYNVGLLKLGGFEETSLEDFEASWRTHALGAFACCQLVVPQMLEQGAGSLIFVGATGSVRGGARSHAFASSKHALRGFAHGLAKEFGPKGLHVAHVVVDGKVWGDRTLERFPGLERSGCIEPEALALQILQLIEQPRSAWTFELDVRPWSERWA